jgi:tetratricopeptide (TPR) repeat protein
MLPATRRILAVMVAAFGPAFLAALAPDTPAADSRPRATRLPDPADRWIRAQTAHLTLYSDASEEATVEIGRRIELYRAALAAINPALSVDTPLPTSIFVFRNAVAFGPYKLQRKGELSGLTGRHDGYFIQHGEGNYIAVNATADADPWPVIYHEYFHFFSYNNFTDIPLWLGEGLAEYYGTFQPEGASARIGGVIKGHEQWLKGHPLIPLPRLFKAGFDSDDYQEPGRQQTFYAQSWALVHMLIWGPKGAGASGVGFLRGLPRGGSLAEAIAPAIADPVALTDRLENHLRSKRFAFNEIDLGAVSRIAPGRVTPLERPEALYRLGDLLLHSDTGRLADAEAHFREAVRLDPAHAHAHAGLGQALALRGRSAQAKDAFERAFTLAPEDPGIVLKYAMALTDIASPQGSNKVLEAGDVPPDLLRARELFERLTRTSPDLAEAWAGLGATYAYAAGDLAPGIAALERARKLMPSRPDLAVNLCWLYVRNGQHDRARALNDRVISRSSDPAMRVAGRDAVFWAEVDDAVGALKGAPPAGRQAEEALSRLRRLATTAPTPALRKEVEEHLRESESYSGQRRGIAAYNEAVEKANAGDYDGAARRLEAFLEDSPAPELARDARKLLAEVRAVSLYNGAVEKARRQDYSGALALLNRMPSEVRNHPVVAAAASLRKQVKEAMNRTAGH